MMKKVGVYDDKDSSAGVKQWITEHDTMMKDD